MLTVSLHFGKITLHLPNLQGGDGFDWDCVRHHAVWLSGALGRLATSARHWRAFLLSACGLSVKNFGQCVGELLIKNGNIGGAGHVFIITAFAATMYCRFRRRSHRPTPAAASSHSQCLPSKDFGFSAVRSISSMQRALTSILSGSERGT